MNAKDFMTTNVFTCKQNQTVEEAATLMVEKDICVVPVLDDEDNLVGIITESDFVGKDANIPHALASIKQLFGQTLNMNEVEPIYSKAKKCSLESVMTKNPKTIEPDTPLTAVVSLMNSKNFKRLPVVEGKKVVGLVTRKNLLKAFLNSK